MLAAAFALAQLSMAPGARADVVVVDRIVAVVDRTPILLSTLRRRAAWVLERMKREVADEGQQLIDASKIYQATLEKLVDEQLVARVAREAAIEVSEAEIDATLVRIARTSGLTRVELLRQVDQTGMGAEEYRRQVRLQLLEAQALRISPEAEAVQVADEEVREAYAELRRTQPEMTDSLAERSDSLRRQIYQRKFEQAAVAFMARLRSESFIDLRGGA